MTTRYLLDTCVLSEPLRPHPDPSVIKMLKQNAVVLFTASPVWHELNFGVQRLPPSHRRNTLARYLREVVEATIPILPYDDRAALWHAHERARLTTQGLTPAFVDGQIAAIAAVNDLVVITTNLDDFSRFEGITLKSWHGEK